MPALFSQSQALTTLGSTPLVVLTASESVPTINGWTAAQDRMTALCTSSSHLVADSSHQGLLADEQGGGMSFDAITTSSRRCLPDHRSRPPDHCCEPCGPQ
jgi:hypothetical protein